MSQKERKAISNKLINAERTLRKIEKLVGIKSPKWSVRVNPRNTGAQTKSLTLSDMQIKFCEEYPKDLNGTQAAIRAGYSPNGAGVIASNLLKLDKIRTKIETLNKSRLKRLNINVTNTLREIGLIAFSNVTDVARWTAKQVTLKPSSSLSRQETAAIKSISETITPKSTKLKVEMYDKPQALMILCRYLNILDGKAEPVDAAETVKNFKTAFNAMFDSVPTKPPGEVNTEKQLTMSAVANAGTPAPSQFDDQSDEEPKEPEYVMED